MDNGQYNALGGAVGAGLGAGGAVFGILDSLFGKNTATRDKRRALNAATWAARRNMGDLNAWGAQTALDTRKGVTDANAKAQQFVQNQGLAGSTITPTLMAGNTMRGNDQLARVAESILQQRMNIRNAQTQQTIPLLMAPSSPGVFAKLANTFNVANGGQQGGGAGALANAAGQFGNLFQQFARPKTAFGAPAPYDMVDSVDAPAAVNPYSAWTSPARSGFYGSKAIEKVA